MRPTGFIKWSDTGGQPQPTKIPPSTYQRFSDLMRSRYSPGFTEQCGARRRRKLVLGPRGQAEQRTEQDIQPRKSIVAYKKP